MLKKPIQASFARTAQSDRNVPVCIFLIIGAFEIERDEDKDRALETDFERIQFKLQSRWEWNTTFTPGDRESRLRISTDSEEIKVRKSVNDVLFLAVNYCCTSCEWTKTKNPCGIVASDSGKRDDGDGDGGEFTGGEKTFEF